MKKLFNLILLGFCIAAGAQKTELKTGIDALTLVIDGNEMRGAWSVSPQLNPDILETTGKTIKFISDSDSLTVPSLGEWEFFDFNIVSYKGDTAHVRVKRIADNPFENPDPRLLKHAPSRLLTRQQAQFDIDALLYALSQVHPDIFAVCRQEDLLRAVNKAKGSLPDSISKLQLYRAAAPLVAMIGDGHTNALFPYNELFTKNRKRMPVYVDVMPDRAIICTSSLDSVIPKGARIVSINGATSESIINTMLPYASGEKEFYKISALNTLFTALFEMLFEADNYVVEYIPEGSGKVLSHTFSPASWEDIKKRCPATRPRKKYEDYSFAIDKARNIAVMDFRSFNDISRMEHFADSMFRILRHEKIDNLIIDIRYNGGGNSGVGDVLLSYISPKPFIQMEKTLAKISPFTAKLMGPGAPAPNFYFYETDSSDYIKPRAYDEGHYSGNVYLLTSNKTFSSAGSFAWAFKECGAGTVVGEETGGMNVAFGDVLLYSLPVSGINVSLPYKRFWQWNADENDIHGTIPHVVVPSADALDTAKALIAKKSRKRDR